MNRIKEVLEQKGIKQIWLAEQLGKELQYGTLLRPKQKTTEFGRLIQDCGNLECRSQRIIN